MATFSISDAAFSGFRVIARKPQILLYWFGFSVLTVIVVVAIIGLTMAPAILQAARTGADPNPAALGSMIGGMLLGFLLLVPVSLLLVAVRTAAANRAVLRPQEDSLGYLRIGGDEFRLMVVLLVVGLLRGAAIIALSIVLSIVTAVLGMGRGMGVGGNVGLSLLTNLLIYAAMIFLAVKFSMAAPRTLDRKAISIFESWTLTNGHFWRIFLVYLIDFAICFGIGLAAFAVFAVVIGLSGLGVAGLANQMQTNPTAALTSMAAVIVPLGIAFVVVGGLLNALVAAIVLCPAAHIYASLTQADAAEVF